GLCALSSYYRPFLFCFDQTEVYGSDKGLVDALGRCAFSFHGQLRNHMTVATTNRDIWVDNIHPNLIPADRARFSKEILLKGINREQADQLIAKRLEDFRLGSDAVSKFVPSWLASQFSNGPFLGVRHLLMRAAEHFRGLAHPTAPIQPVPKLDEIFA